ncbi:MAG: hypothetical protein LH468_09390 [Nocardioides sp.]|nr:hypothetical protein [Nocardioides sp.]
MNDDREPPPTYLGVYPHALYWSAERPAGVAEDAALESTVGGDVIRFMWDYGVVVPLWDGNGPVPEEPEWLRSALGLSDVLIDDLRRWGTATQHLDANPPLRTEQAYRDLDQRARRLVARFRQDLGSRFTVTYRPW